MSLHTIDFPAAFGAGPAKVVTPTRAAGRPPEPKYKCFTEARKSARDPPSAVVAWVAGEICSTQVTGV